MQLWIVSFLDVYPCQKTVGASVLPLIFKDLPSLPRETLRERGGKKCLFQTCCEKGKKRVCVCVYLCWGGFVTVTNFDRHIRLQKEHPARGWGHMVLPSAGVALDQVTTLAWGSRLSQVYSFCPTLLNKNRRKNKRGGLGGVEWVL